VWSHYVCEKEARSGKGSFLFSPILKKNEQKKKKFIFPPPPPPGHNMKGA